jgi:hypothetical protein
MTPDQFRSLALRFPGVVESLHMNHPDFRIEGKVFATLGVTQMRIGLWSG